MKKISTLFKKDPEDLSKVTDVLDPENTWVLYCGIPTRKYDGTACAVIGGEIYRRYDAKKGKTPPVGAIPCQDPDPVSGHWPHWVKCVEGNPSDVFFIAAFKSAGSLPDGTYELCGEKIQGNPEKITGRVLIPHGKDALPILDFSFAGIREYLRDPENDVEGIVFHAADGSGRMCKIRKVDFGFTRKK